MKICKRVLSMALLIVTLLVGFPNEMVSKAEAYFQPGVLYSSTIHFNLASHSQYGKADSTLAVYNFYGEYHYILVDCGDQSSYSYLHRRLNQIIKNKRGQKPVLDKLVITHHHDDHMGAVNSLLNDFYVKEIVYSRVGEKYEDFKQAKRNHPTSGGYYNYSYVGVNQHKEITFTCRGARSQLAMRIYAPRKTAGLSSTDEENNQSMVVAIFGYDSNMCEYNAILMGDIKYAGLREFMDMHAGSVSNMIWGVVQYGHHGIRQSDTPNEIKMYNDYLKSWNYIATCDINGQYYYNRCSKNRYSEYCNAFCQYYWNIKPSLEQGMINRYGFQPGVYSFDEDERKGDICLSTWLLQEPGVK